MAQNYTPKPISFVPPILKRKFIAPDNPREMGTLVMLISFAVVGVALWPSLSDALTSYGARSAKAEYVGSAPYRSGNEARKVGVYVFQDEANANVGVRGNRVHTNQAAIPKSAHVVWPKGRAQKAKVIYEHKDYLVAVPIGLAIFGFGLWLRRKRIDAFAQAMNGSPTDETTSSS
jgi:hypothetical protein